MLHADHGPVPLARLGDRLIGAGVIRELPVGVVVSDSFGRAWRRGTTDVALGVAGIVAVVDLAGSRDSAGYELHATEIAVADEIAGAAQLVMGKTDGIPAAVVRGLGVDGDGRGSDLVMPRERDLFRSVLGRLSGRA